MTLTALRAFTVVAALCSFSVIGPAAERPSVMGRNAGVSAGHPLTTAAAFEVLTRGGNAFDAGVAALLAIEANVLIAQMKAMATAAH